MAIDELESVTPERDRTGQPSATLPAMALL
jgi:hypothetical protein